MRLTQKEILSMTHCPRCNKLLQNFECIINSPLCYCPDCDIIKMRIMSAPYLCSKCDSELFIGLPNYSGGDECFLCSGKMRGVSHKYFSVLFKKHKLKRGYFVSNDTKGLPKKYFESKHLPCHKKTPTLARHNKLMFKGSCQECDFIVYIYVPEWMQEKYNFRDKNIVEIKTIEEVGKDDISNVPD